MLAGGEYKYGSIMSRIFSTLPSVINRLRRRLLRTNDDVKYGLGLTVVLFLFVLLVLSRHHPALLAEGNERESGDGGGVLPVPDHHDVDDDDQPGRVGPGEMGVAVNISKASLGPEEEKEKYQELFDRNSFNQYASDLISVKRRLPDMRSKE